MHNSEEMSFWDHLDVLRAMILKIIAVTLVCGIIAFCFKENLFGIVLAPQNPDFATYRILSIFSGIFSENTISDLNIKLINTGLAEQFVIHIKTALCVGILCASPYILYQLFRFVSPALYIEEKKYVTKVVGWGYIMFMSGVLISYYLIFPLTFRFLGTYQVNESIANMITLQSYISTLITMSLMLGLVFELPVILWMFGRLGIINVEFLCKYRRHAIVIILILAAIITPTSDVFTLAIVSFPLWILYEASIAIVKKTATSV